MALYTKECLLASDVILGKSNIALCRVFYEWILLRLTKIEYRGGGNKLFSYLYQNNRTRYI